MAIRGSALKSAALQILDPQSIAFQAGQQIQKKASQQSIELFGYDFVSLILKLVIFFVSAFIFAKFMEAVIFARGIFLTMANLLGFKIPVSEQIPETIKDLFNGGYHGIKYWNVINGIAIILIVIEFIRYNEVNTKNGGKSSPMTIGVFLLIGLTLTIITIVDIFPRIKKTDLLLETLK